MIIQKGSRAKSKRTRAELLQALEKEMATLTPEERETLQAMIDEMRDPDATPGPKIVEAMTQAEYYRQPVSMEQFMDDPYYLGESCANLYSVHKKDLIELFEGGYHEAVWTGSIGIGKSFVATVGLCRILYELSCLKNPQKSFGLADKTGIALAVISVNEGLAVKVVLENVATKILPSPYFKEYFPAEILKKEIKFPNNITVVARASTDTASLGLNIVSAIIDEGNFLNKNKRAKPGEKFQDRADFLYDQLKRRMKSRFERRGKLPGILFLLSSKQTTDDFINRRVAEAIETKDPTVFVRDYCLSGDTKIPLLDGTEATLRELAETRSEEKFWVYSIDPETKLVVPGLAHHPRLTKKNEDVLIITLDNGETIKATASHPLMLRNFEYKRAGELSVGDSLMPLYRTLNEKGYERVGQPLWDGRYQATHTLAAKDTFGDWPRIGEDGFPTVVHHKNFNKRDNRPENLEVMSWTAHQELHKRAMDSLLRYVRSPEHREWASAHMKALHGDPEFKQRKAERGSVQLKKLWSDPAWRAEAAQAAGRRLSEFHKTELGRKRQVERNTKRWATKKKVHLDTVLSAVADGISMSALSSDLGVTTGAIANCLRRAGYPKYNELLKSRSPHNHKIVSIKKGEPEDVYDLSVDKYENFAISAGVFVHNSLWDVRPEAYLGDRFYVLAGNDTTHSRILEDHEADRYLKEKPDGTEVIAVPEDFRADFERDIEGSLRDIAGVSTSTIAPYIQRREKIQEAIDPTRKHPFSTEWFDPSKGGRFLWEEMVRPAGPPSSTSGFLSSNEPAKLVPIINPGAVRHVHVDPSIVGDATGMCMAHIGGWKDVERRATPDSPSFIERAPVYVVDFLLRVVPPVNGELILADSRQIIYDLSAHGYVITSVSMDSPYSVDAVQTLRSQGYNANNVSVDKKMDAYDNLKMALYENRVVFYNYPILLQELLKLQVDWAKNKVDHPANGSKDVADALAGCLFTLSQAKAHYPLPILASSPSYTPPDSLKYQPAPSPEPKPQEKTQTPSYTTMLPPFILGGGGSNDDGSGFGW